MPLDAPVTTAVPLASVALMAVVIRPLDLGRQSV